MDAVLLDESATTSGHLCYNGGEETRAQMRQEIIVSDKESEACSILIGCI